MGDIMHHVQTIAIKEITARRLQLCQEIIREDLRNGC